jgi:hypothetical protein
MHTGDIHRVTEEVEVDDGDFCRGLSLRKHRKKYNRPERNNQVSIQNIGIRREHCDVVTVVIFFIFCARIEKIRFRLR